MRASSETSSSDEDIEVIDESQFQDGAIGSNGKGNDGDQLLSKKPKTALEVGALKRFVSITIV